MNISLISFISSRLRGAGKRRRFIKYAGWAALVSVMLGSLALIVSLSVLEGFDKNLRQYAVKFTSHLMVITFNHKNIDNYEKLSGKIRHSFPEVIKIAPVIEREGLLRFKGSIDGAFVRGIIPENDISSLRENIVGGRFGFSNDTCREMVIGKSLAAEISAGIGDSVFIYTAKLADLDEIPEPKIVKFKIVGIYETSMQKYDNMMVFIPFKTAAWFYDMPEGSASFFEILLTDINLAPQMSDKVQNLLGYPYYALTVFEQHSAIFAWIDLQKKPIPVVLGLISAVAALNIITTLLILIVEKTNSIGILRTMGMDDKGILMTFVFQGLAIGAKGTSAGSLLALGFALLQNHYHFIRLDGNIYNLNVLPVTILPVHYFMVISISLLLSFLASLIPSLIAVRISPLKAIRFK